MAAPITERAGALSAVGVATEATFGTAVAATNFLPMTGCTIEPDPGLFYPELMMGYRDKNIFPLYGQFKYTGAVDGPLFPSNGVPILVASIGYDGGSTNVAYTAGSGVTGTSPSNSTTTTAPTTVGGTSVTLTSATGYTVGDYIQLDTNVVGTSSAEVRKISTVSSNTITVDKGWSFVHPTGATAATVIAPFTHSIVQSNGQLPSLTVEKNIGGFQSEQYAGTRVNKFDMKTQTTDTEVTFTADVIAQTVAVLDTPTAVTVTNEKPFVFSEVTLNLFGQSLAIGTNFQLSVDNALKPTYTFNGASGSAGHELEFLTPTTRLVNGQLDVVWSSLDDATYGYFNKLLQTGGGTNNGALECTLAHPSPSVGTFIFDLPAVNLSKYADDLKMADVVMSTLSWEAALDLSNSTTIGLTIINNQYLPY